MIYLGTLHVLDGRLTLGSLTVFISYLAMLYAPIEALTQTAWALEGAAAGAQRCFEVLDHADDVRDAPGRGWPSRARAAKSASRTWISATIPHRLILRGVNLDVQPGRARGVRRRHRRGQEHAAFARAALLRSDGGPGAARRTRPARRSRKNRSARRSASSCRTRCSFRRRCAKTSPTAGPDATEEEIIEAAERAQADEFIRQLPHGYDSPVGERGGHLSVGQRQRIGIARAFLKNSPDPAARRADQRARSRHRTRHHGHARSAHARADHAHHHATG